MGLYKGVAKLPLVILDGDDVIPAGDVEISVGVTEIRVDKDGKAFAVLDTEHKNG